MDKQSVPKLDPKYLTGIPGIDKQHNDFLDMSETLLDRLEKEKPSIDYVSVTFQGIMKLIKIHFETEETLMDMIAFPKAEEHKAKHREIIRLLNKNKRLIKNRDNDELKRIVGDFKNTVYEHITDFDREYAAHIENLIAIKQKFNITVLKAQSIVD